jgi:hypothetical protein
VPSWWRFTAVMNASMVWLTADRAIWASGRLAARAWVSQAT